MDLHSDRIVRDVLFGDHFGFNHEINIHFLVPNHMGFCLFLFLEILVQCIDGTADLLFQTNRFVIWFLSELRLGRHDEGNCTT